MRTQLIENAVDTLAVAGEAGAWPPWEVYAAYDAARDNAAAFAWSCSCAAYDAAER